MNPQVPPTPSPINFPKPNKTPMIAAMILGSLFVLALVFGLWAFSSRSTIKKDADTKLATASSQLAQAQTDEAAADAANKSPYKTFTGPETYGSVSFQYPKSWSAYVDQTSSAQPVEGYFYPGIVPGIQSPTAFALRVELTTNDYSSVVGQYEPYVQDNTVKASAYIPPKMKKVSGASVGLRLDGGINQDSNGDTQTGSMVILKVRDKTLQIYTESPDYVADFNKLLTSVTYKP